jgi:transglutaminase-like putative cysteine protease/arginine exporter protein ArgO
MFTDVRWLADVMLSVAVVAGTAALLRLHYRPRVWQVWLGLAVLVPVLTARFVSAHAFAAVIPTGATWTGVSRLLDQVRDTTHHGVAPVPATEAIRFVLAVTAGLLAAFVDLVAVVGRRPALAGVPLLVVFTISGAVSRHPVSWVWFVASAVGFLLLLSIDSRDEVRTWGRAIPRAGDTRPSAGLAVSGPRIAATAVLLAVVIPLVLPARGTNLLSKALHTSGGGSGNGTGIGAGGVSLDPFSALKGQLQRSKPVNLFTVTVSPGAPAPFYVRANVLSTFTPDGWRPGDHPDRETIGATAFDTNPPTPQATLESYTAEIQITGLTDNPPIFAFPQAVIGVPQSTVWSQRDALLLDATVHNGDRITEQVGQPAPTTAQLDASGHDYPGAVQPDLDVPAGIPAMVGRLVTQLTAGRTTPYAKARALSDFFTNSSNGFSYSLQTKAGDSGNALVDFLTNRTGFCQQYAAAMGIMLRMAGVPARVVLGYTHGHPDTQGRFVVTSENAHAWVEAYFPDLGWIPFDPTPISNQPGAATTNLAWAPHPANATNPNDVVPTPSASRSSAPAQPAGVPHDGLGTPSRSGARIPMALLWTLLAVLVVAALAATPAALRRARRRRRLRSARGDYPDPLWAELIDTATDLGYVWSPARSPRQVLDWLRPDLGSRRASALAELAAAVERSRYAAPQAHAPGTPAAATLIGDLTEIESALRAHRSRATRVRSRVLPASLGLPRMVRRTRRRR